MLPICPALLSLLLTTPPPSPTCNIVGRPRAPAVASMARVYADVNQNMPRSYWDYDSVNIGASLLVAPRSLPCPPTIRARYLFPRYMLTCRRLGRSRELRGCKEDWFVSLSLLRSVTRYHRFLQTPAIPFADRSPAQVAANIPRCSKALTWSTTKNALSRFLSPSRRRR